MRSVGEVVFAEVMQENGTGRSKGCGVCEFKNEQDAQKAIAELNDTDLKGRMIFVREDRESNTGNGQQQRGNQGGNFNNNSEYIERDLFENEERELHIPPCKPLVYFATRPILTLEMD